MALEQTRLAAMCQWPVPNFYAIIISTVSLSHHQAMLLLKLCCKESLPCSLDIDQLAGGLRARSCKTYVQILIWFCTPQLRALPRFTPQNNNEKWVLLWNKKLVFVKALEVKVIKWFDIHVGMMAKFDCNTTVLWCV